VTELTRLPSRTTEFSNKSTQFSFNWSKVTDGEDPNAGDQGSREPAGFSLSEVLHFDNADVAIVGDVTQNESVAKDGRALYEGQKVAAERSKFLK
jgi:hypothetical protein